MAANWEQNICDMYILIYVQYKNCSVAWKTSLLFNVPLKSKLWKNSQFLRWSLFNVKIVNLAKILTPREPLRALQLAGRI